MVLLNKTLQRMLEVVHHLVQSLLQEEVEEQDTLDQVNKELEVLVDLEEVVEMMEVTAVVVDLETVPLYLPLKEILVVVKVVLLLEAVVEELEAVVAQTELDKELHQV